MNSFQVSSFGGQASHGLSTVELGLEKQLLGEMPSLQSSGGTLVFVDSQLQNYQELVEGIEDAEVIVLAGDRNGLVQITETLSQKQNLGSVQIFSHGDVGALQLGNAQLDASNLNTYGTLLQQWGQALNPTGDLLLYGCNVAAGNLGQAFVQQVSQLTQADVMASNDLTGNGGDWQLEVATGQIEAQTVLNLTTQVNYRGTLATYNGHEYLLTNASKTWVEAQAEAIALGGNLVTVNDGAEEAWLQQTFGTTESFWIGLTDEAVEGQFQWVSGEALGYTNWAPGQPDNYLLAGGEDYVALNFRTTQKWNDASSTQKYRGIIELNTPNNNAGVLGFSQSDWVFNEGEKTATLTVNRTQGITGTVTVDYATVAGTAIASQDYTAQSGTLTFAPGETQKSIQLTLLNDTLQEGDEAFTLELSNPTGGATLTPNSNGQPTTQITTQITLRDDESSFSYNGKTYRLTQGTKTWAEAQAEAQTLGGNLVTVNDGAEQAWLQQTFGTTEVLWNGMTDQAVEGQFQWISGEAVTYTHWAPGQPDDYQPVGGEDYGTLNFRATRQWNDAHGSNKFRGVIEITPGAGNPGVIGLATSNFVVNEGEQSVTVKVLRTQGASGTVTIDYSTVEEDAIAGEDFVSQTGTLTFETGEVEKSVVIPLLNDMLLEGDEAFGFVIDRPTGGATLLAPRTAQITLRDDESSVSHNGKIYRLTQGAKTWDDAQAEALTLGGNLVTINDATEQAWLEQTFGTTEVLWTGLTDEEVEGQFKWISGEAVTYTHWAPGQPDDYQPVGGEDYGTLNFRTTKQWNDANGLAKYRGLIEITDPGPVIGTGNGLRADYYDNRDFTNPTLSQTDATVDFNWGSAAPLLSMGVDTFSVRWTGQVQPLYSETYQFKTTSDDGVRLWVNNQLIIDKLVNQATTSHTGSITLEAGQKYDIRLDYFENTGNALAQLAWSSPSQTLEIIPQTQLYSDPLGPNPTLVSETVVSNLVLPTAIDWTPDGSKMFVAEKSGVVKLFENGVLAATPFIDISTQVNDTRDRGLLDIAVHPDFANHPYVYLLFTYDPPEVYQHTGDPLAGPDQNGNRASRLIRVTANASTGYSTAIPGSEVVLLGTNSTWDNFNAFANSTFDFNEPAAGILPDGTNLQDFLATDSESHSIGSVKFGPDGALYVSNGDGASYNRMDPRGIRVQDIDNLSGKILRIDPITGEGLANNPFFNGDAAANRSKVYQYGLRNPFRISVDDATGKVYIGDVGWTRWEEINAGAPGANFGWPYYEGGSGANLKTTGYRDLPEAIAFYASGQVATPSLFALSHSGTGINAIVMGDVYNGSLFPESYQGDLFFNDLGQGIVRNVSFDVAGNVTTVETFTTGANVVVQIVQGPDGALYYVDLDDGVVGRWLFE